MWIETKNLTLEEIDAKFEALISDGTMEIDQKLSVKGLEAQDNQSVRKRKKVDVEVSEGTAKGLTFTKWLWSCRLFK